MLRTPLMSTLTRSHAGAWRCLVPAILCLLAACGGGDDEPPPLGGPDVQTGTVAAGSHVQNAVVFLDLNDNNVLDINERRTTTDANGHYTLTGLYAADLASHSIVVRIFPDAIDTATGQAIGLDCTLKAPPGRGAFVSPFSTLVSAVVRGSPALTVAAAAEQVAARLRASTLPLTAPAQLDLWRDYVADSASGASTAADSRQLRLLATSVAGILSAVTAGLNQRQSVFDANSGYPFDTLVTLTEAQLTVAANGSYQFDQLDAVQQANLIANPAGLANLFVDGNAMLNEFIASIRLSDLLPDVKDFIANSDTFKQFFASVIVDLASQVAELIFHILF
jgi:hypothetical protein